MLTGYECRHCGFKFKCLTSAETCTSCGYWYTIFEGRIVPALIQHNEESFLNDPNIPIKKSIDDDPSIQGKKANSYKSEKLKEIRSSFSNLN